MCVCVRVVVFLASHSTLQAGIMSTSFTRIFFSFSPGISETP